MFSEGNSWMLYDLLNAFRFDDVEKLAASLEAGSAETLDNYDFLSDNVSYEAASRKNSSFAMYVWITCEHERIHSLHSGMQLNPNDS
ncbi:hypothetical protein CLF_113177 [Clonorchis sinensis]|uniref:Uncharacterized protein n=1 Tax=Clonorchis sinensis TaxID=79923 RepID=G7YXU0_CLOSI|nr:hypothetical protein CLF_113177 [Clonorchis sinensis]